MPKINQYITKIIKKSIGYIFTGIFLFLCLNLRSTGVIVKPESKKYRPTVIL